MRAPNLIRARTGNEELILGYGFSIVDNPDDTLALKLGIPTATLTPDVKDALSRFDPKASPLDRTWYIPRSGILPNDLYEIVRIVLSAHGTTNVDEDPDLEMDVAGLLLEMVQTKLERLNQILERNEGIIESGGVREAVWNMVQDYVAGELANLSVVVKY